MDGIPPALATDSEDVAWALQTAEALWKRGERADAVVWVRRAAQAAGESDDAKRAAQLGRQAAELGERLAKVAPRAGIPAAKTAAKNAPPGKKKPPPGMREQSLEELDRLFGEPTIQKAPPKAAPAPAPKPPPKAPPASAPDVEVMSSSDFEAGFRAPSAPAPHPHNSSDSEIMTVSIHAPDIEVLEEEVVDSQDFPEEEPTPIRRTIPESPLPPGSPRAVPTAAEAHIGMLDPWAEGDGRASVPQPPGAMPRFEEEEVVTSAKHPAQRPPSGEIDAVDPQLPRPPRFPAPGTKKAAPAAAAPGPVPDLDPSAEPDEEADTTTYRQINQRAARPSRTRDPREEHEDVETPISSTSMEILGDSRPAPPRPPPFVPRSAPPRTPPETPAIAKSLNRTMPEVPVAARPVARPAPEAPRAKPAPRPPSEHPAPAIDLLELVDSVVGLSESSPPDPSSVETTPPDHEPTPTPLPAALSSEPPAMPLIASSMPTPHPPGLSQAPLPASARPTAPPPGSMPAEAIPSAPPTRPRAGSTLLDLSEVEALADLPDDARESFAAAAKVHSIGRDEELSNFALALVIDGIIDVSAQIVDAPALRLERNSVLRSRGTLVPGVPLRLVCASDKALVATWGDVAVADAFRTCPWVEEELRNVTDVVQARAGMTMGPLGERFDMSLRDHMSSKLTVRTLGPGETLVAQGKPVTMVIVGVGEIVVTRGNTRTVLGPGDFVFPQEILAHGSAPGTATAGDNGAIVLYGDRAASQELLMGFPPILEVLATI